VMKVVCASSFSCAAFLDGITGGSVEQTSYFEENSIKY
jgi:hypothetical protein